MGCQCANQKEELNDELGKNPEITEGENDDNIRQKEEINDIKEGYELEENNINQVNEDKNTKYAEYPEKMLELINKIREDPVSYAEVIEDSIKNIIETNNETKPKIIYKKKVKVALTRGEPAFREAAELLRNMEPLPPLEFKSDICAPLPDNEEELKEPYFLREQVKTLRETTNIDIFFKDLIKIPEVSALLMIVDDGEKNAGRKRNAVLNKDYNYIGINSKFIGKNFIAYFTFSK